MNKAEIRDFAHALVAAGEQVGRNMNNEFILDLYVETVQDLPAPAVMAALKASLRDGKMPTANELRAKATGTISETDEAQDTADRIIRAIKDHGSYQSAAALKAIGPVGAEVVARFGGWAQVCEVTTDGLSILRAQLRDSARSVMARARAGRLDQPAQLPGPSQAVQGLKPASAILQLVTGGGQRPARAVGAEDEAPF